MGEKDRGKWLVAVSCCFINCMLYGVSRLSGMLLIPLVDKYSVSRASASLPFSISSCIRNLTGPFAGQLSQYFGIRQVAIFGCILATVGSSLCCYADSMLETTIFWGGIFGTGLGISTTLMPLAINQNFSTYQSTASGISYSGAFLGSFIFPPLLTYAIYEYGLSGSFLIISGVMLNSLAAAMFLRSSARTKVNDTRNCNGEKKGSVVAYSKSKTDKSDSSLRSRFSVIGKFFTEKNVDVHSPEEKVIKRKCQHDNPVRKSQHDNPVRKSQHDNPVRKSQHDNPVRKSQHDNAVGNGQHDNRILISPNDLTFPKGNVCESKYEPPGISKYFRSGRVNTSNKTHMSDDKLEDPKQCVTASQCLDYNDNVSSLVKYNEYPTKSENALRNGCSDHLASQFTQINEVHSGVKDTKKNTVQSSSDILAFADRMTETDPVYILNLNGDAKNLDNTNMLSLPRNTVYQKYAEYLTLIKRSLGFNVASYSLTPRRESAIYDIHEEYLKERHVNPLRKNAKYLGNIAIYNFDMETKDTNVEVTSYKNIIDDSTELSTERHPPNPVKGNLSNPSGIMESINGKVCQEDKNEHKLLAKRPSQDYAEPLTHPKIQAMDSFPAYHKLSKRASSFNVLDSDNETSKNFEGCFLEWLKMFTDPVYMSISGTMSLFSFITISILTIIEDFAEDCGVSQSQVHFVLMTMSGADLLGTLSLGWITDKGYVTRSRFTATCFLGIAVVIACIPLTSGLCEILVVVALYGVLESGVMIMFPLLTAEYINPKRHTIAIASTNLLSSPAMLLVPLAIGYFRDNLGQYDGLFYLLSLISVVCCGVWLFVPLLLHKRHQTM